MNKKETLTKAEIVNEIYLKTTRNRAEIKRIVEQLITIMKDVIRQEGSLLISGFGKFSAHKKHSRKGRNPQTDRPIVLPSRNVLTFVLSKKFRAALNKHTIH